MFRHEAAVSNEITDENRTSQEAEAVSESFDAAYCLRHNPDVAEAKVDPLLHFLCYGWKEGRDPNSSFSVSYYLEANPDVRDAGVNPFWHYITAGKAEGRAPRHPGGYRAEILLRTRPFEETIKARQSQKPPESLLTSMELYRRVLDTRDAMIQELVVSCGHDNYRRVSGGVQYCIQHEQEIATGRGAAYLNLHPLQPLPRLAHMDETGDVVVSLLLDGEAIGAARMSTVIEATRILAKDVGRIGVVVHHLLGHNPEQISDLTRATGKNRCVLWLHDFFTLCPNFVLQRNNVSFCGAPPETSNACSLCLYGSERVSHLDRMAAFFEEVDVDVVAPSQFAADFWTARTSLSAASVTVLPHAEIEWEECAPGPEEGGRVSVAFIGYPAPHKGWPMFERLVRGFRGSDLGFDFVYLGTSPLGLDGVENVHVHVTAEEPNAMIRALAERRVDFVLHWASCAETFSFSTHEALASGAYVLTNACSGNVAATVRRLARGAVLADENELEAFFHDGRAAEMAAELRARRRTECATMHRSAMSLDVLENTTYR